MSKHLQREIDNLKKGILFIGAIVEEAVQKAVHAIEQRDEPLAQEVVDQDVEIDRLEVELEEECLKVLALNQPVAIDLRYIVAILKINNDLERIGDLAQNIAERAIFLARHDQVESPLDLTEMGRQARDMLRRSLDALVNSDTRLAVEVCRSDAAVDEANRAMYPRVTEAIRHDPQNVETLIQYLSVSRNLERIADHATNIAEDVYYMLEGEIVRHRGSLKSDAATDHISRR